MGLQRGKAAVRVAGKRSGATSNKVSTRGRKAASKQLPKNEEGEHSTKDPEEEQQESEEESEEEDDEEEEDEDEDEAEEISEEDKVKQQEDELQTSRKKELKGMYIDELKELAASKGVEPCKKEEMIDAVVAAEAKQREELRVHKAKLRAVVVEKKEELEALPLPELREVCNDYGIKGQLTKQARVAQIMKLWQEADGVDKALAKRARDERAVELEGLDKVALRRLSEKARVEPFVKEVMVERLVRLESAAGKFARPTLPVEPSDQDDKPKKGKRTDMVDELLEHEARRKKEAEHRKQQEENEASKRKELRAMSVEELKKMLAKKGHDATGKKDDMVEALHRIALKEEAVAVRKAKLHNLALDDLKKLVTSRGLSAGKKDEMIDAILEHEAQSLARVAAYEAKIEDAMAKLREGFEAKSAAELKDLCAAKNLKLGLNKEGRIDTLLEDAKTNGSLCAIVAVWAKADRTAELLAKDAAEILKLCEAAGIDPLVKEVLVERLLAHEAEFGRLELDRAPPAKRARRR